MEKLTAADFGILKNSQKDFVKSELKNLTDGDYFVFQKNECVWRFIGLYKGVLIYENSSGVINAQRENAEIFYQL